MRAIAAFDRWIASGPFTARDLGIYRIICAALLLVVPWRFRWMDQLPDSMFVPPPGPLQLFSALPPQGWFAALEVLLVVAIVLMGAGVATRWTSLLVSALLLLGAGFTYSFGKIDHAILLLVAPAVLSFSNWGAALSIDSLVRRGTTPPVNQWAVRLLAIIMGLCFASAAAAKIVSGWLSPDSQAVKGYFLRHYFTGSDHSLVSDLAASLQAAVIWEVVDWAVIAIELFAAIAFLSWRLVRFAVAVAAIFHLGVMLLLGIRFYWNVVVYGAFLPWGRLVRGPWSRRQRQGAAIGAAALATASAGAVIASLAGVIPEPFAMARPAVVWIGAGVGAAYLLASVVLVVRRMRKRRDEEQTDLPRLAVSRALRGVVVLLVLSLPVAFVYAEVEKEPYPALLQPDFRAPGPLQQSRVLAVWVQIDILFADGSARSVDSGTLLGAPSSPDAVFKDAFHDPQSSADKQNIRWLEQRLTELYPGSRPTSVTVTWLERRYDHISGELMTETVQHARLIEF